MPLGIVQHLLELGVIHHLLLLLQIIHGDLEELLLPEHLGGDEDLGNLPRLKLGLLDFLTDQVHESVQLVLVRGVAERVDTEILARHLPGVEIVENLLESLLGHIRDDGLTLHSLLQTREEHGPEDLGPGAEHGLVDLETSVADLQGEVRSLRIIHELRHVLNEDLGPGLLLHDEILINNHLDLVVVRAVKVARIEIATSTISVLKLKLQMFSRDPILLSDGLLEIKPIQTIFSTSKSL